MKLTIIGAGNMGGATARGLILRAGFDPKDLTIVDLRTEVLEQFRALGVTHTTTSAAEALEHPTDVVIVAVKPWLAMDLLRSIAGVLCATRTTVVSLVAGVDLHELKSVVSCPVVRVIPNTAIEVGESMSFLYSDMGVDQPEIKTVQTLFDRVGHTLWMDNEQTFAGAMALSSCGIAYAMRYVRAATEGGVELGVAPKLGVHIVAQTLRGAAELLVQGGGHPEVEIDKVTTPGGITIRGLNAMEEHGFTNAVIQGLKASK